jgi:hypothetical protein
VILVLALIGFRTQCYYLNHQAFIKLFLKVCYSLLRGFMNLKTVKNKKSLGILNEVFMQWVSAKALVFY